MFSEFQQRKKLAPDILTRVHFFQQKERILAAAHQMNAISFKDDTILLYPDISAFTLAKRCDFKEIPEHLQAQKIPYRWGFPFSDYVPIGRRQRVARSPKEARVILGLVPPETAEAAPAGVEANDSSQEWHESRPRRRRDRSCKSTR